MTRKIRKATAPEGTTNGRKYGKKLSKSMMPKNEVAKHKAAFQEFFHMIVLSYILQIRIRFVASSILYYVSREFLILRKSLFGLFG